MNHPILSENDLISINYWISNLEHQRISNKKTRLKVVTQAKNSLNFDYKYIGSGRSRIVFDLGVGFVLKIAISYNGINGNEREFNYYTQSPEDLRKHLCPVEDYSHGWIIMKKIEPPLQKDEKYNKQVLEVEKKFIRYGIYPGDIWRDKGLPRYENLSVSDEGEIIVIDYGNFRQG